MLPAIGSATARFKILVRKNIALMQAVIAFLPEFKTLRPDAEPVPEFRARWAIAVFFPYRFNSFQQLIPRF